MPKNTNGGIPTGTHSLIEDIEHRTLFINTNLETGIDFKRNIPDKNTETDGYQQHGLEIFLYRQIDKEQAHHNHSQVREGTVGKAGILPELD